VRCTYANFKSFYVLMLGIEWSSHDYSWDRHRPRARSKDARDGHQKKDIRREQRQPPPSLRTCFERDPRNHGPTVGYLVSTIIDNLTPHNNLTLETRRPWQQRPYLNRLDVSRQSLADNLLQTPSAEKPDNHEGKPHPQASQGTQERVESRCGAVVELCTAVAGAFGCECLISIRHGPPGTTTDPRSVISRVASHVWGSKTPRGSKTPSVHLAQT
jgi:hypothetical protein